MNKLALVRHGESEWNARGVCTGIADVGLTALGREEARKAAELLRDITLDVAHVSMLRRAQETLAIIKDVLDRDDLPVYVDAALNERDYGKLTGKSKRKLKEKYGEEQYLRWRRGWDYPVPGGETLRDVFERVVPYYENFILPDLVKGKNILVSAHGNLLRALIKYLENISDHDITSVELNTGEVCIYEINAHGKIVSKDIREDKVDALAKKKMQTVDANPIPAFHQIDTR